MSSLIETEPVKQLLKTEEQQPSYIRDWLKRNTFHYSSFSNVKRLVKKKRELEVTISLCFPTLNEEKTVGKEIRLAKKELMEKYPLLDEIVVVDSGSVDRTEVVARRAGANFFYSSEILPQLHSYRGKGENLWKSLYVLKGDIICWVDADILNFHPRFILGLIGPLLEYPHLCYVKAFYRRPIRVQGEVKSTGGGRVTELVVRPFFNLLFPDLTGIAQPLSGEYAGRRDLLENIPFFTGYGVETGHLIDIDRLYGIDVIGQCDLNVRIHRNQSIEALRNMSYRILKILLQRADDMGRIEIFQDISDSLQIITGVKNDYSLSKMKVWGTERPPMVTIREYREKRQIPLEESKRINVELAKPLPYTASVMFHRDLIIPRLKGRSKEEVIKELVEKGRGRILNQEKADRALVESGDVVHTAIGKNIVFFHAFGDFVDDIVPIIGISAKGIEMKLNGPDLIHVTFMFLAPEYLGEIYKKMVDSLTRSFSRMEHFEWLLRCETPDQIIAYISYLEAKNKIMKLLSIEDFTKVTL